MRLLILCLFLATVMATPVMETNFLSPAVGAYNDVFRYAFRVQSPDRGVATIYSNCDTNPALSPQMSKLYQACGAHNFIPTLVPNPYRYGTIINPLLESFVQTPITSLPHNTTLWLEINADSLANIPPSSPAYQGPSANGGNYQSIMGCLQSFTVGDCLSAVDLEMIACLTNTTDVATVRQPCSTPLSVGAVLGITFGSLFGGSFVIAGLCFGILWIRQICRASQSYDQV